MRKETGIVPRGSCAHPKCQMTCTCQGGIGDISKRLLTLPTHTQRKVKIDITYDTKGLDQCKYFLQ